jgi:DUF3016 family protein
MTTLILLCTILLNAVSVRVAGPDGAAAADPMARIAVVFEQPQHFTDMRYTKAEHHSVALLDELHTFMCDMGEHYVPIGMRAEIKVTDIDLAGDFEPWRGPQFDQVRITRDIYPPHIFLEFRLTDGSGRLISAGKRVLRDIAYQRRIMRPPDDYLRYEKDILRDWFRSEFGGPRHAVKE